MKNFKKSTLTNQIVLMNTKNIILVSAVLSTLLITNQSVASQESARVQQATTYCTNQSMYYGVDFGTCISQNLTNEEAQVVFQCVRNQGYAGPQAVASCAVTGWTISELNKCQNGIGNDGGCFGPGNTIRRTIENGSNDIFYGPGDNNDLVGKDGFLRKTFGF